MIKPCRRIFYTAASNPKSFSTLLSPMIHSRNQHSRQDFVKMLQLSPKGDPILHYKAIHRRITVSGFHFDTLLANILINAYSKSDSLDNARKLFDKMSERNLSTWSSMISAYTQHGYHEEALAVFLEFLRNGNVNPNEFVLASVIRASTEFCLGGDGIGIGCQLHSIVVKTGLDQDVYVGTSLVGFYSKSGNIEDARSVFDGLPSKSAVTWTTIIAGYARSDNSEVSLQLFNQMTQTDVVPDKYVLSSILNACSVIRFLERGKQIHAYVLRRAEMDVSVSNALIDFYVKCGKVRKGQNQFDQMVVKNVISWTTMISGYMQNSFHREAMELFAYMSRSCWRPDGFACTSILTSCGSVNTLESGSQIHCFAIKANLDTDEFVNNSLVDMYSKCNSVSDARRTFDEMPDRSVIGYNTMIEGYSSQENVSEALKLFHEMRLRHVQPSVLTFVSLLGVSASLLTLELSRQIHGLIIKSGVSLELYVGSALIDVYSKCSHVVNARLIFEEMNDKDIVAWNAMLSGYSQQSENENAFKLYTELQLSRQKANEFTFVAMITAASNLASLPHGRQLHNQILKTGQDMDPFVTNALLDMYAKCGSKEEAQKIFTSTVCRDVVCWNSMILTFAQHGEAEKALSFFEEMVEERTQPNYVTFVAVLSACDHMGLVKEGFCHFESMSRYGIEPGLEHYACMVSLLCRAGKLYEAKGFIEEMPIRSAAVVWRILLSACRITGNVELGKFAAEVAISIDPKDSGSYILLSNIFASRGMWVEVKKVRERMECNGVIKEAGCSWIEMNNEVNVFVSRDNSHPESDMIYSIMDTLIHHIKKLGYAPDSATLSIE